MKIVKKQYIIWIMIISVFTGSCVEPFEIKTITFEDALVIEATITNELKHQEINLTRTFQFEEDGPSNESNARVRVVDDVQNIYDFEESTPGKYLSILEFSAQPDINYVLEITTTNGRSYSSQPTKLTGITQIENVSASREISDDGDIGLSIFVDSFDPSGNSRYYRYEYEETYKIIPLFWSRLDAIIISDVPPFEVGTTPRTKEERICFNTLFNNEIIQTQTNNLLEDRVSQFPIQFVSKDNPILRERYSILVTQYVQSLEAFTYYKILNELSGSESILSQNQPGFINGNVSSMDDPDEKVLGFFEIASVSSKRIFINFRDIFPGENRPFYFFKCNFKAPLLVNPERPNSSPLIDLIKTNSYKFFDINLERTDALPGRYLMVENPCGDCTELGTNIKPDFWVD